MNDYDYYSEEDLTELLQIDFDLLNNYVPTLPMLAEEQLFADLKYPYRKYQVPGQNEVACELTAPQDLPADIRNV